MRGAEQGYRVMFSYVDLKQRVPTDHPVRSIEALVEPVLRERSSRFLCPLGPERPAVDSLEQLLRFAAPGALRHPQ
jgi:hypothetical protein